MGIAKSILSVEETRFDEETQLVGSMTRCEEKGVPRDAESEMLLAWQAVMSGYTPR